ncbi:MAG TPA: hypothetical protein VIF09_01025 [Polyangiaceae bacterium]
MQPRRLMRRGSMLGLVVGTVFVGCLSRPVSNSSPVTQTIFSTSIDKSAVKRVDLLFLIDNSKSMGDKQAFLSSAVPDLLTRLVTPDCVDDANPNTVVGVSSNGACATGHLEFPPVDDLHIAVVTSSLGSMGGDVCPEPPGKAPPNEWNDDAQLINRGAIADAPEGFLAYFPPTPDNAGASPTAGTPALADPQKLVQDFQQIVGAVGEGGCGIEAQLESWYRFLVQPDPYQSITVTGGKATLTGVDATVLSQRAHFLRPDSLLAIIDLTDEDDSSIDVRAFNGSGVAGYHMNEQGTPPFKGTSACATSPGSSQCTSCDASGTGSDPVCSAGKNYDPATTPQGEPNIRHIQMKQEFGLDSQYPITRYLDGLTQTMVPDRTGEYPDGAQTYVGTANCYNPIFAQGLPDGSDTSASTLCNLTPGPRTPDLVYYAHIGGVPNQLLHYDPTNPASTNLSPADWKAILGNDPSTYDTTGIDPRMVETYEERPVASGPSATATTWPEYWDLKYACTFTLAQPRDCTQVGAQQGCDCAESSSSAPLPAGTSGWELCQPGSPTMQVSAKAYPTIRELYLAKLMAGQGVVSSLCPIDVTEQGGAGDPLYGYRPAMASIIQRLKTSLLRACVPHKLTVKDGNVDCLVLASLPTTSGTCDPAKGLSPVDAATVAGAASALQGQPDASLLDTTQHTVCQMAQLPAPDGGSCDAASAAGWCYVVGAAAGNTCGNAIAFSAPAQPATGVKTLLSCIESTPTATQ